ncbi:MAG: MBL fold metallo-hydrolase [Prolixibacteraceae bacterium]|nr:MBL fold metallo-hydrolase [Prolixibacteraceae bacterium]
MELTVVVENHVSKSGLGAEHGLSFVIESNGKKIMFDTGQSKLYARNAKALGFDVAAIDALVISHGHYDHVGGLPHFIENNDLAPVYLKKEALWPKFHDERYIGVKRTINALSPRFKFVEKMVEVIDNVFIVANIETSYPDDSHKHGFFVQENENTVADNFADELFLVLKTENAISIVSSCSHNGITNIVETARRIFNLFVNKVIGGFHIKNDTSLNVDKMINYFNIIGVRSVFTGHCTGIEKFVQFQTNFKGETFYLETGTVINL